jgi:hypothetical protein
VWNKEVNEKDQRSWDDDVAAKKKAAIAAAKKLEELTARVLWSTDGELQTRLASCASATAKKVELKAQLEVFKIKRGHANVKFSDKEDGVHTWQTLADNLRDCWATELFFSWIWREASQGEWQPSLEMGTRAEFWTQWNTRVENETRAAEAVVAAAAEAKKQAKEQEAAAKADARAAAARAAQEEKEKKKEDQANNGSEGRCEAG